jgi:predicted alpha/beta hydrolase
MSQPGVGNPEAGSKPATSRPLYFGPAERPLFGWLHAPVEEAASSVGCVICSPFGDEAIRTHRTMRHLAAAAAHAGIPTLRFDYDGTGDSAGHDLYPDRLASWLASIRLAATTLRQTEKVERICFVGLRLGAALAALVASESADTAGLAAIAPVVSGKAYVRELRLLRNAIDAKRNIVRSCKNEMLETAGFLLTAETQASLSAIDLVRSVLTPPARVLILDREDLPGDQRWAQQLRAHGARVEQGLARGYPEMMLDCHDSVVPHALIQTVVQWLQDLKHDFPPAADGSAQRGNARSDNSSPRVIIPPDSVPDPVARADPQVRIEESAVQLAGPSGPFGIISCPVPSGSKDARRPEAILLLNAGAVHHIGPCRLYVALARRLARSGYVVMRMDIAGLGDSLPCVGQPENVVYAPHALTEIATAIEYLRHSWGASEVRALGLCSGAYHAFKAAVARFPLTGAIVINPLTFFWKEGMSLDYPEHRVAADIARYRKNMRSSSSWRKLLAGRVDLGELIQVVRRHLQLQAFHPIRATARRLGIRLTDDLPTELLHAVRGGIDLQFVFAAGDPGLELLRSKAGATAARLRADGSIGVELIPEADHTFTDLMPRSRLVDLLVEKLARGASPPLTSEVT